MFLVPITQASPSGGIFHKIVHYQNQEIDIGTIQLTSFQAILGCTTFSFSVGSLSER